MNEQNITRHSIIAIAQEYFDNVEAARIKIIDGFHHLPATLKSIRHGQVIFAYSEKENIIYVNRRSLTR